MLPKQFPRTVFHIYLHRIDCTTMLSVNNAQQGLTCVPASQQLKHVLYLPDGRNKIGDTAVLRAQSRNLVTTSYNWPLVIMPAFISLLKIPSALLLKLPHPIPTSFQSISVPFSGSSFHCLV